MVSEPRARARALWDTTITFDDQYKSDENFSKLVFYLLQAVWSPIWWWFVWKYHLVDVTVSEKLQKVEENYFTPEIQY